jgi:hypothetical protein
VDAESADGRALEHAAADRAAGLGLLAACWRLAARWYSAAYEDGDLRVRLFRSTDGPDLAPGATIYDVAADTPLETELIPTPSRRGMLALVRMDGTDFELFGNAGGCARRSAGRGARSGASTAHRSCTASASTARSRSATTAGFSSSRAAPTRPGVRKRTALYELTGTRSTGRCESPSTASSPARATPRTQASRASAGRGG